MVGKVNQKEAAYAKGRYGPPPPLTFVLEFARVLNFVVGSGDDSVLGTIASRVWSIKLLALYREYSEFATLRPGGPPDEPEGRPRLSVTGVVPALRLAPLW